MRKYEKIILPVLLMILLLLFSASPLRASTIEETVEESMKATLIEQGIDAGMAGKISKQYLFMGTVMINKTRFSVVGEDDLLLESASKTGTALGNALAASYSVYGGDKLQETASVMMHSTRAGVLAETASETFEVLARNGYAFDSAVSTIHQASELVRALRLSDSGNSLCASIRMMASENIPIDSLKNAIVVMAEKEVQKHKQLLAQRETERKKIDNRGGEGAESRSMSASRGENGSGTASSRGTSPEAGSSSSSSQSSSSSSSTESSSSSSSSASDSSSSSSSSESSDSSSSSDSSNDSNSDSEQSDNGGEQSDSNGSSNGSEEQNEGEDSNTSNNNDNSKSSRK